jgi:thiaminase
MSNKQTAVEWLINIVVKSIKNLSEDECEYLSNLFQQAEEMEKQQIMEAYSDGAKGGANNGKG